MEIDLTFSNPSDPFGRFVVVSFYTRGGYYEDRAEQLKAMCDGFGLEHDIAPIELEENENWAAICRRKVRHYGAMLKKHKCDIMWVDVDSIILRDIHELHQGHFDVAIFMRNFKYMPQYNVGMLARNFHPGYLVLRYTPRTLQFIDDCLEIDRTHDGVFTDDYILEEAFRTSGAQLRLMLLSPDDIERPGSVTKLGSFFRHGDSGNVDEYKGKVRQHVPKLLDSESQRRVFEQAIAVEAKAGNQADVLAFIRRLRTVDPDNVQNHLRYITILEKNGDTKNAAKEISRGRSRPELAPYTIRHEMLASMARRDWETSDRLYEELLATGHQKAIDFAKSRRFRFDLDRRSEAMGVLEDKRTPLFWWEEPYPGNLGDIVNPYIVEKLSGIPPKYAKAGEGVCAIGSIIKFAKAGTPVWGSGSPHEKDVLAPDADYRAVRGPLTRDLVLKNNGNCPSIYGDAAWFLPIIFEKIVPKTHRTGLILHYTHEEAPITIGPEIRQIGIRRMGYEQIEAFLEEMLSCERIISTSLHGVIIAQAYGIPAALATAKDSEKQVHGDGVKFRDYFLSVGLDEGIPDYDVCERGVTDSVLPDSIFRKARTPIRLTPLLSVAPFKPMADIVQKAMAFDQRSVAPDHAERASAANPMQDAASDFQATAVLLEEYPTEWIVKKGALLRFPGFALKDRDGHMSVSDGAELRVAGSVIADSRIMFLSGPVLDGGVHIMRISRDLGSDFAR